MGDVFYKGPLDMDRIVKDAPLLPTTNQYTFDFGSSKFGLNAESGIIVFRAVARNNEIGFFSITWTRDK